MKGEAQAFDWFIKMASDISYIGDSIINGDKSRLLAAIRYIGYLNEKTKYPAPYDPVVETEKDLSDRLNIISEELASKRSEISVFMGDANNRLNGTESDFRTWYDNQIEAIENLKKTYEEKLHLEAPEKHWKSKAEEQKKRVRKFLWISMGICAAIVSLAAAIIWTYISISDSGFVDFIPYSLLSAGAIAFMLYIVRTTIKIMVSAEHLQIEYEAKGAFTYFYLSLLQRGEKIDEKTRLLIYSTLFGKVDTGLVKQSESDSDIYAALISLAGGK
jgi:hypothetical protein